MFMSTFCYSKKEIQKKRKKRKNKTMMITPDEQVCEYIFIPGLDDVSLLANAIICNITGNNTYTQTQAYTIQQATADHSVFILR